jgi:Rps23 Pro-64 3,4-dihydroxylase Tpa1-like proline 4-hydroxylase
MNGFNRVPSHGVVRGWLGAQFIERLLVYAQANEHLFKESTVTYGTSDRIDTTHRVSRRLDDFGHFKQQLVLKVRELLPAMFQTLGIKPFKSTVELELVAHGDGAFFARHIDTLTGGEHRGGHHRIISAVYYFNTLPKAFSGGVLRLHSLAATSEQGAFVDIPPDYDTLVFFPSMYPHEVLPVQSPSGKFLDSRFAINCWICSQ